LLQHFDEDSWVNRVDQLSEKHYVIIDDLFQQNTLDSLLDAVYYREEKNLFRQAAIGSSNDEHINKDIRRDHIFWLDQNSENQGIRDFFGIMEQIRQLLNRYCYLSLSDSEFHLSHYPPGAFYKRHFDQFQSRNNRIISCVLYLNKQWSPEDGGQLRIYNLDGHFDVNPEYGRVVLFKSAEVEHEVLITQKDRFSVTGWMLYRPFGLENI
jgi:SM-20-related protein